MSDFKARFVECIQRREGGTHIKFGSAPGKWPAGSYHFAPGLMRDARHAALISVEAHYERLLSLPEGFRPVHPDDLLTAPAVKPAPAPAAAPAPAPAATTPPQGQQELQDDSEEDGSDEGEDTNPDVWSAENVLKLSVNKIIGLAKTFSDEQIRELLDAEGRREDPRESLVKSLTGTLRNRAAP